MKISYNWLKQFIELDWDAHKIGELLTDLGLEVEGISSFESVKGGLDGIVVGEVLECEKHPNADRLKLTKVTIGQNDPVQIVCGAPNVEKGQKVPVATIGTTLYTPEGEAWKIKKGKIRGEESHGMICAEDELGLGDDHDGIMVLDEHLKPGTPCSEIFEIELDQVFEIGLTPNRSDAMSHFGVARDLRAGLEQHEVFKKVNTPSTSNFSVDNRSLKIDVEVEDNTLAPRYCGVTISNILVQDSPFWLQNRLKAIGLSPINNVVDVTNYVMHELGQPLHAFDAAKIKGNQVVVKTLAKDSKFITLDGVERTLDEEDLMICDSEKPMCIAGVFGGINSGVTENTTSVFLESAYFNPVSVRKTAKRHGLNTDASFRFERGIDIDLTDYALKRAAQLIKEIAGGEISSDLVDVYPNKKEDIQVFLTFEKVNKLVGEEIPKDSIKSILASLEIKVVSVTESGLGLIIPSYRADVLREVDVIEEILRIYGYNKITFNEKFTTSIAVTSKIENHKLQSILGDLLASRSFYEIMTNSLVSQGSNAIGGATEVAQVAMLNPLSADLAVMRTSMLSSGLESIVHNLNRKQQNLKLFEFGKVYNDDKKGFKENEHLCLWITGNVTEDSWSAATQPTGFFYLKGIVNTCLERIGLNSLEEKTVSNPIFSEGLSLKQNNNQLVEFGVIKNAVLKEFDIESEVFYADFDWEAILKSIKEETVKFTEIPKFPEVKRDLALLVDENVQFKDLHDLALKTEKKLLKKVSLFDVYTGKNLPKGKKSYALSFALLDTSKTLTDKKIDAIMGKLQDAFKKEFGAELR
ncbi:phenylalanine--tRNA ligase subunit beta [Allomuricauda sp. d1]|uniref:phenylalanine--tRNA ligase subunit beta n=1 Tax=Allomuricauda sp. d1 TaxID=3136725 RepID=UPI0031DEC4B5